MLITDNRSVQEQIVDFGANIAVMWFIMFRSLILKEVEKWPEKPIYTDRIVYLIEQ